MIYILTLIVLVVLGYGVFKKKDNMFLIISGLILFLMMGLRSRWVGTDSHHYFNLYINIANGGKTVLYNKCPLFFYILLGSNKVFGNYIQIYFIITSLLIILPIWLGIYISKIPCREAVLLYYMLFFQTCMNGTRTMITVAFVFLAYILAQKKELKSGIVSAVMLIASFFIHKLSIIGIFIVALSFIKVEKKTVRQYLMIGIAIASMFVSFYTSIFANLFDVYKDTIEQVTDTVGASAIVFQGIFIICLLQSYYIIRIGKDDSENTNKAYYNNIYIVLFTEVMLYLVGGRTWYVQRLLLYPQIFILLLFPVVTKIRNRYIQLVKFSVYFIAVFYFVYCTFRNINGIMPYRFYW